MAVLLKPFDRQGLHSKGVVGSIENLGCLEYASLIASIAKFSSVVIEVEGSMRGGLLEPAQFAKSLAGLLGQRMSVVVAYNEFIKLLCHIHCLLFLFTFLIDD